MIHLAIEADGSICEAIDSHLCVLPQQWQERYENGIELVIVSVPVPEDNKQKKQINKVLNRFMFNGQRYALSAIPGETNLYVGEVDPGILMLRVEGKSGRVFDQKAEAEKRGEHLNSPYSTRMVAGRLFPGIKLAQVKVPDNMNEEEEAVVRTSMARITWNGVRYGLVGGTGGAKDGKFYYAEAQYIKALKDQYQDWCEAAIAYFGIQVSECDKGIIERILRIRIVEEHQLGTNDSRLWFVKSVYDALNLSELDVPQIRLASEVEPLVFNAKGTAKMMPVQVAQHPDVAADIIMPTSCIKPALDKAHEYLVGTVIELPVVLGVRDVSRTDCTYKGSYTVLQHASWAVINEEIIPLCMKEIETLKSGFDTEDHAELLKQIGGANSDTGYFRVAEGCLAVDRDGWMSHHPHIHGAIKKLLAQWAYKMLTGGGMKMPGRMLIDDGFLAVEDGKLYSGSDWIPYHCCITDLPGKRNLCVRYPVRMVEDLLPMTSLPREAAVMMLMSQGLSFKLAKKVFDTQLNLHGTYTLHAERAKTIGGDYDGDCVAVITSSQYPMFVDYRFDVKERPQPKKDKSKNGERAKTKMLNVYARAFKAMGNKVGAITNAMSSAIAAGDLDLAFSLVIELQKEIDSLKHNTEADMEVVRAVMEKVGKPEWLDIDKKLTSVDQLKKSVKPLNEDADVIAKMYNVLYPKLMEVIGTAGPISDYAGLFDGVCEKAPTPLMKVEGRRIKEFFGSTMCRLSEWEARFQKAVADANVEVKAARSEGDKARKNEAYTKLRAAKAKVEEVIKAHRIRSSICRKIVCGWGRGKDQADKMTWATQLNRIVSEGKGNGAIIFHAFPQQFADAVAYASSNGMNTDGVIVDVDVEDWTVVFNKTLDTLIRVNADSTRTPLCKRIEEKVKQQAGSVKIERYWRLINQELAEVVAEEEDFDCVTDLAFNLN
jgi:hypothetical protein